MLLHGSCEIPLHDVTLGRDNPPLLINFQYICNTWKIRVMQVFFSLYNKSTKCKYEVNRFFGLDKSWSITCPDWIQIIKDGGSTSGNNLCNIWLVFKINIIDCVPFRPSLLTNPIKLYFKFFLYHDATDLKQVLPTHPHLLSRCVTKNLKNHPPP